MSEEEGHNQCRYMTPVNVSISHYDDFIPAVNRCVESDYEIRIYRNRSLKGSRRNLASFCNLSMWKSQ